MTDLPSNEVRLLACLDCADRFVLVRHFSRPTGGAQQNPIRRDSGVCEHFHFPVQTDADELVFPRIRRHEDLAASFAEQFQECLDLRQPLFVQRQALGIPVGRAHPPRANAVFVAFRHIAVQAAKLERLKIDSGLVPQGIGKIAVSAHHRRIEVDTVIDHGPDKFGRFVEIHEVVMLW